MRRSRSCVDNSPPRCAPPPPPRPDPALRWTSRGPWAARAAACSGLCPDALLVPLGLLRLGPAAAPVAAVAAGGASAWRSQHAALIGELAALRDVQQGPAPQQQEGKW
eukprot:gene24498-30793_t